MPAAYSQKSAADRAERQAWAGYTYIGVGDMYVIENGVVQRTTPTGPPLPKLAPGGVDWSEEARLWYDAFRVSPQADLLSTNIDWQNLMLAVAQLNNYYEVGSAASYNAFERMVAKFGTTPGDRKKLRISVGTAPRDAQDPPEDVEADMQEFDVEMEELEGMFS